MPTRVLIIDDSATARLALRQALELDEEIQVVGESENGEKALHLIQNQRPDIATMDVFLRGESGIDLTAMIMATSPLPILVVTSADHHDPALVFDGMAAGALDVKGKLPSRQDPNYERKRMHFVRLIKTLSKVPVVKRKRRSREAPKPQYAPGLTSRPPTAEHVLPATKHCYLMVVIGASTGGPQLIQQLLQSIPVLPLPIAIAQHISSGFSSGLRSWLAETTGHDVVTCSSAVWPEPGRVYLAPDDHHLVFGSNGYLKASSDPPRNYQRPSIDYLFETAVPVFGRATIGILLSGMGTDGVDGIASIHSHGGRTIAQDPSSCVVDSMPRTAIERGVVDLVQTPSDLAQTITKLAGGEELG